MNDFGENIEDGFGNVDGGEFGDFLDLNLDIGKPAEVSGMAGVHVCVFMCNITVSSPHHEHVYVCLYALMLCTYVWMLCPHVCVREGGRKGG